MWTRFFLTMLLVLSGWAFSSPPVHASCVVETSGAYAEGDNIRDDKCDTSGNKKETLGTLIAGEDQAANVIRVEGQFLSSGTKTADAQIKATPGYVDVINCYGTDAAAVAGTIILYDNTAESGTILWSWTVGALDYHIPFDHQVHAIAATGIYLGYTTTTDVNCTVSYR